MLQVPFVKISVEDRAQDLLDGFSVEAAVQDPSVSLSAQGVFRRSAQKIFVSQSKISVQAIDEWSRRKTSGLFTRSLYKISRLQKRCLRARSVYKSGLCTDLCKRSHGKTSGQGWESLGKTPGQALYKRSHG